jgi:hypothetical protein
MSLSTAPAASVRTLGHWSAILCTVFSLTYVIAQLAEWAGWLLAVHFDRLRDLGAGRVGPAAVK